MNADQQALLIKNIVGAMKSIPKFIQERQVEHFMKADKKYGEGVKEGLSKALADDPRKVSVVK